MNPQRPNCLNNDYEKGCKVLQDAYASLFEGFASIIRNQVQHNQNLGKKTLELQDQSEKCSINHSTYSDQKSKRDGDHGSEKSKKYKGAHDGFELAFTGSKDEKVDSEHRRTDGSTRKAWGSWAQALHQIAMHPEKHKDDLLEISEDIVVLNDMYPKVNLSLLFFLHFF
jgi:aprataxin